MLLTILTGNLSKIDLHRRLVNASGVGKTRLLFEGLTRHWGFYFTLKPDNGSCSLGSTDVVDAINEITKADSFVFFPGKLPAHEQSSAFANNDGIAQRHSERVLTVRYFVFKWFMKSIRELLPDRSIDEFRKHWLFLQLQPVALLGTDVFSELSRILKSDRMKYLLFWGDFHNYMCALQEEFKLDDNFTVALDDAQEALYELPESFPSLWNNTNRPVLIPLLTAWKEASCWADNSKVIIAGISASLGIAKEAGYYKLFATVMFFPVQVSSAFDDHDWQRKYMLRYLPTHLVETDSGKALLERAWNMLRGRYAFLARRVSTCAKLI